ncbi:syndecan-1 [Rhinophrynus dorsalis]
MDKVLAVLFLLGICCSLGFGNEVKSSYLPEDQDGSGDDEDLFSGSGFDEYLPVDVDIKDGNLDLTSASPFVLETTTHQPDSDSNQGMAVEHATRETETTKPQEGPVDELHEPVVAERPAVVPTSPELTTHMPTTHRMSTAKFTTTDAESTDDAADPNKHHHHHPHHHHHHHHHHNKTTTSPALITDPSVHHEDTTAPPEVYEPNIPHIIHEAVTTSVPDDGESDISHVNDVTTLRPNYTDEPIDHHHIHHQESPSGSSSTPSVDYEETTKDPAADDGSFVFLGHDDKQTTTPHDVEDSHVHVDHHDQTTSSADVDGSDVHQAEPTSSPPHIVEQDGEQSQNETADVNKHPHHHHHHHHHPHHHTTQATTPSSTEQPDEPHTLAPVDGIIPDTTTSTVQVLEEDDLISISTGSPEQNIPVNHTVIPMPGENDADLADSKEDEASGENPDTKDEFFFERKTEQNEEAPDNKLLETDPDADEGSSGASHGIMERKEILGGIIAGGVAGLLFAVFLVGFMLYRMKKKDEGSYSLEEPKQSNGGYQKPREQREFYA